MTRFTLPSTLASLTSFCVAAGTYRLFTAGVGGDAAILLLFVSCTAVISGFSFLTNEVPFFLGLLIVFLLVGLVLIWR